MHKIFEKVEELAALKDPGKFNAFMVKHLDIQTEKELREFTAHFEIWSIRKTQEKHVGKMREWEKAYNRGTEVQKEI